MIAQLDSRSWLDNNWVVIIWKVIIVDLSVICECHEMCELKINLIDYKEIIVVPTIMNI